MGAPSNPTEEAVYAQQFKRCDTRVIVALDPPKFTQEQHDGFTAGPLSNYAWAYQWLTNGPLITGSKVTLRYYIDADGNGVPLFEWFATRESYGWFPYSRNQPFACEFPIKFPEADPVYSVPIIVPGLENLLGDLDDPLLIYQQGSATSRSLAVGPPSSDDGNIRIFSQGADVANYTNDLAEHTVRFEWDPLLAVNSYKWTLKWDGSVIQQTNSAAAPNIKAHFGWSHNILVDFTTGEAIVATGTPGSAVTVLEVSDFKTTQLGSEGYESYDDPAWAVTNHGATSHDDADEGEIHTQDNHRWAIIPSQLVGDVNGDKGRIVQIPNARVALNVRHGDPDDLLKFAWGKRPILIDVKQRNAAGSTAWRRKIAGYIKKLEPSISAESLTYSLSIDSMIGTKLNYPMMRTWRGDDTDNPIVNVGYTISDIWNDILDVAEAVYGADPTASDRLIRAMTVVAGDDGTGGQKLIDTYARLVDESAYEYYEDYTTTGDARHGRMRTHAWNLGNGSADYGIPASQILSMTPDEDVDEGPSQVTYRQNNPEAPEDTLVNTWYFPTVGLFPTVPVPNGHPLLSDTIAFAYSLQETALLVLKDKNDANVLGGIAQHRFRLQSAQRRRMTVRVRGRDHFEPSDEIELEDPISLQGETWIIDRESWSVKEQVYESTLTVCTSDWIQAIKRSL